MSYQNRFALTLVLGASLLGLSSGFAQAGVGQISSPYVTKGEWEIKNIGKFENSDDAPDAWEHELEVEYGVFERMKLTVGGEISKEEGESLDYEATEIGAKFQLFERGSQFVDMGIKFTYAFAGNDGEPDEAAAKFYAAREFGGFDLRLTYKLARETGDNSSNDWSSDLALGGYKHFGDFMGGLEYFADFGTFEDNNAFNEQDHSIGPIIGYEFHLPDSETKVETKLGAYAGVSDGAPDTTVKYELEFGF